MSQEMVSGCAVTLTSPTTLNRFAWLPSNVKLGHAGPQESFLVAFAVPIPSQPQPHPVPSPSQASVWAEGLLAKLVERYSGYLIPDLIIPVRSLPVNRHGWCVSN